MRLLDTIMAPFAVFPFAFRAEASDLKTPRQWLIDWVRGGSSDSGVSITADSAMTLATIW